MATSLESQLNDLSTYSQLGFEERLGLLVDEEWNLRQTNRLNRHIRTAHFSVPSACVEGIEYHDDRKLDQTEMIRFSTCKYIEDSHHIILKGASGNGKTYISNALGNAACRKFKTVRYIRMPELLDDINVAKGCGTLKKLLKSHQKVDLLILDEWLIRTLTQQESYDLLEIIETRSKQGSIIFCTQYEPHDWYVRFNSDTPTDSEEGSAIKVQGGKMKRECTYRANYNCDIWMDYQIQKIELEEAEALCKGNWKEIQELRDYLDYLEKIVENSGINTTILSE